MIPTGKLDRRTTVGLVVIVALLIAVIVSYSGSGSSDTVVAAGAESIPAAEARLQHLRQVAANVPAKQELLKKAQAELVDREKGMLTADTGAQAQAQLLEMVQRVARANGIDVRGMQQWTDKVLSEDYGEISDTVTFSCGIEQLVNFLSALADNQPQILATNEIRIAGGHDPKKNIQVRLSVSAVVARKLIPKKGTVTF